MKLVRSAIEREAVQLPICPLKDQSHIPFSDTKLRFRDRPHEERALADRRDGEPAVRPQRERAGRSARPRAPE